MRAALVLAALVWAGSLAAQDMASPAGGVATVPPAADANGDGDALERCLDDTDALESCIGLIATPCVERAGGAADAVAACYTREQSAWQMWLDTVLVRLRDDASAADAMAGQGAGAPAPPTDGTAIPAVTPLPRLTWLDRAQSAWIAWRDAECSWHASGFDPQAAAAAQAECRMKLTAQRVLTLEPQVRAVDGP